MINTIKSIAHARAKETLDVARLSAMMESGEVADAMLAVAGEPTTDDVYNGEYDDKVDAIEQEVMDKLIDKIPDEEDAADDEALIAKLVGLDKEDPDLASVLGIETDDFDAD